MARRRTLADDLVDLPWWITLILAIVAYGALRYGVPMIQPTHPVIQGVVKAAPLLAIYPAVALLLIAALSAVKAYRRRRLLTTQTSLESIRALSWREFELLVGEAFRRQGYSVSENIRGGADGGVDLELYRDAQTTLVQCKHWKASSVPVQPVRELQGVVSARGLQHGILVCTGRFTAPAEEFAASSSIELIDGQALAKLVDVGPDQKDRSHQSEVSFHHSSVQSEETCPLCGSEMHRRVARRGKHEGNVFLGCSRFPKCRGTRSSVGT